MRRRELVAGIGSVGVLGGAGAVFRNGLPSVGGDSPAPADDGDDDPLEVETVDAPGSAAGAVDVRDGAATATVVSFFASGCGKCQAQVPRLAEAHETLVDRHGDAVRFLSVTYESADRLPPADLREWWIDHGGAWSVGYDDGLAAAYGVVGYPVTVVVDADAERRWRENGVRDAHEIVRAVERVLEADAPADDTDADGDTETAAEEDTSDDTDATDDTDTADDDSTAE